ncbi:hypothetical protein Acsp07_09820 [Actinomycetospora sp. NBRC 106378]|nr:hypothetical protein Acsp07_09820 [Actinomycetospora sp. NBRC 106378]
MPSARVTARVRLPSVLVARTWLATVPPWYEAVVDVGAVRPWGVVVRAGAARLWVPWAAGSEIAPWLVVMAGASAGVLLDELVG